MKDLKTTNTLLLLIAIPVVFFVLKTLSFIFIPLFLSMFISVLFLPLMRWFQKRKLPKLLAVSVVVGIVLLLIRITFRLLVLSGKQVVENSDVFLSKAKSEIDAVLIYIESFFGGVALDSSELFSKLIHNGNMIQKFGPGLDFFEETFTMILMTAFFVVLWLAESINVEKIIKSMMADHKYASVKTFLEIESKLITFVKMKVIVSLLVGLSTGLLCYFFDVHFPVFWGLFALVATYVQMIGPLVQNVLLIVFAAIELDFSSKFIFFVVLNILIHTLITSVLEPIFMGKSFSINVITILIMIMLWGYIWGIPGMILAIPITVFVKIVMEQFPATKGFALLMSGNEDLKDVPD